MSGRRCIRVINFWFFPIYFLPGKRSHAVRLYASPLQIQQRTTNKRIPTHEQRTTTNNEQPTTNNQPMYIVVSYDISDDKRRTKIHKTLSSYGQWMQYSLFECSLSETEYAKLRARLSKLIKSEEDSIRFYFLCGCCQGKIERIGGEQPMDTTVFFA